MKLPLQVSFRDMVPLPSLDGEIRRRVAKLERFVPELISCHVVVQASANRHRQGHVYAVKVDVRVPDEEVFTGEHQADEEIAVAVHGAFDAMTRRLQDYARRRRGQVKDHASAAQRQASDREERGLESAPRPAGPAIPRGDLSSPAKPDLLRSAPRPAGPAIPSADLSSPAKPDLLRREGIPP